jgi:hypothetical protein
VKQASEAVRSHIRSIRWQDRAHVVRMELVNLGEPLLGRQDGQDALLPEELSDHSSERRVLGEVLGENRRDSYLRVEKKMRVVSRLRV